MTGFLASVTGPDEAEIALLGGADIIDLKDPAKGALGAVPPAVVADTLARIAGRRPVSAVAGDLAMEPALVLEAVAGRRAADHVKIGVFPASPGARRAVISALAPEAARTSLIAVLFADGDLDLSLLVDLKAAGFAGAMIDTIGKGPAGGALLSHLSVAELGRFVAACRAFGLMSGLAGSLEPPDVPRLLVLKPDYLGFRGALTTGARSDAIDPARVFAMRALIDAESAPRPAPETPTDRIFVRDMVVEMEIGAYGFERGRGQRVRFGVEASVARGPRGDRLHGVYSYDIIMDAVRGLAARGHTDLVETLAEDLAETLLADPRLVSVTVRVEKLELGPGSVGIEIVRPD